MHTYVIAECGSAHDGDWNKARAMVQMAKAAGADACKFQFWSSAKRLAERRHAPEYEKVYERYLVPKGWLRELAHDCSVVGIDFMCTTYLPEDIEVVAPYVAKFKVASFEALDREFIDAHLGYNKPVIVSTGMMDAREVTPLWRLRAFVDDIKLLHCVSAYPAPLHSLNLGVIREWGLDGFSDHSGCPTAGGLAVAAGARIVEVHFRHSSTNLDNPDYAHSYDPTHLAHYIEFIRQAEIMMGDGVKAQQEAEREMARYRVKA